MEVDRQVERLGARQDRLERRVIQEAPVGGAVHQRAVKAEILDRALQFVRRCIGGEHRQVRKAAVAVRVARAGLGQCVIVGARQVDARLARHQVGARASDRQHLHGDPALVHVVKARAAEVGEFVAFGGLRPDELGAGKAASGDRVGGDAGDDAGDGVVLFQGDDAHVVFSVDGWVRARAEPPFIGDRSASSNVSMSSTTTSQTRRVLVRKYAWTILSRVPAIARHGMSGCAALNAGLMFLAASPITAME